MQQSGFYGGGNVMSVLGAILLVLAGLAIMAFGIFLFYRGCRCSTACGSLLRPNEYQADALEENGQASF
jgi:hypothetical protein